jgi:hypothetical protein
MYKNETVSIHINIPLFLGYRLLTVMQLKLIETAGNPEDVIKKVLEICFDQTLKGSGECGTKPDQFLVAISSPLRDWDLRAKFSSLDKNTIESLFQRSEWFDESIKDEDSGRESMITQPFTVDITAIQSKGEKQKQKHADGKKQMHFHTIN